jgi:DNA-binding PadR family transcriptional regulator
MLKYILLGFIWQKPSTGYELKHALDNTTGNFWHAYHSQVYTTLRKLEEEGLIQTFVENGNDHLTRRVCYITEKGKKALVEWLNDPMIEIPKMKEDLLVRVFFSGLRSIPEIEAELRLQKKLHEQQLALYRDARQSIGADKQIAETKTVKLKPNEHNGDMDPTLTRLLQHATFRFGIAYEEMYIHWLDDLIKELKSVESIV